MSELVYDQEGNIVAQRVILPNGGELLVPPSPPSGAPAPPFELAELDTVQQGFHELRDQIVQSSSALQEPLLSLVSTVDRLLSTLKPLLE